LDEKEIVVILDNSVNNNLSIGKYAQVFNLSFVELKTRYGRVEKTALPNNVKMLMQDNRVTVLRPRKRDKGFLHKFEPESETN